MARTDRLHTIRRAFLSLGICGSFALGSFGFSGHVEARDPKDGGIEQITATNDQTAVRDQQIATIRAQLATVDIGIKEEIAHIDKKQQEEKVIKDRFSQRDELASQLSKNMEKAAESYKQIQDSTSILN